MDKKIVERDERTTFIENVSFKFGYNFIAYALLADVVYRSLRFNEAPWDLLGLVILSGVIMTAYQYKKKILRQSWLKTVAISFVIIFVVAFALAFIMKKF